MAHILTISDKTKRPGQNVGDIVAVYDFPPTATERELFNIQEVVKVKAEEVMTELNSLKDEAKEYPKFPHSLKKLTAADKVELADNAAPIATIRTLIKKIGCKTPIAIAATATAD